DKTDTTDDRMFSESLRQQIEVAHTIEYRKDHRFWANGRSEIIHCSLQRIGFHAQEHEFVRCLDLRSGNQFRSHHRITVWTDDTKAILTELFRPSGTDEEGHVTAGLGKPPPKVSADCTGADN